MRGSRAAVAAARYGAEQDDALLVDARPGHQQIDAAHQVPRHPTDQLVADQVQLHAGVVAEVVILPAGAERPRIVRGAAERVLPALAVAELVHHQHQAAEPGPGDAHVLKLALGLSQSV
jgi:hypothetical protein